MSNDAVTTLLAASPLFSSLSEQEQARLIEHAEIIPFKLGDRLLSHGDLLNGVYLVRQGRVRLVDDRGDKDVVIDTRKAGQLFGELAALRSCNSEYTVRGSSAGECLLIPSSAIAEVLATNPEARDYMARIAAISALGGIMGQLFDLRGRIESEQITELVASVGIKQLPAGHTILEQDSTTDRRLYVIRQGRVALEADDGQGGQFTLSELETGEIFGEKTCLLRQPQPASAVARTDVTLFVIPEQTVRAILEHNPKLREIIEERVSFIARELARQRRVQEQRRPGVLFDLDSRSKRGERIVKHFPLIHQAEEMDCGAACLAMICKHHGISITLGKLRDMIGVSREGANLSAIANVAESVGFHARGLETTLGGLKSLELPFIAHWEGYHFVVVYGVSSEFVWIADPGPGFRKITHDEFNRSWNGTCLTLRPDTTQTSEPSLAESPWSRFISYIKPHRKTSAHLFLAALVVQLLSLLPPMITQNVLDRVVVHENTGLLAVLIIALVASSLFAQVSSLIRSQLSNFMTRSVDFAMMSHFFRHTLALPLAFFANRRAMDIMARFHENQTIREFLTQQVAGTILNSLMVIIYLTAMMIYSVKLTLILLLFVVPLFVLVFFITPRMKRYSQQAFETSTEAESVLMESINLAESVKGMGIERQVRLKWENKYVDALNVQYQAQSFQALTGFVSQLFNIGGTAAVLYFGALLVIGQEFTIGQLVAFNMLATSVMAPLMALVGVWDELHAALVAMARLGDVLDVEPEQPPATLSSRIIVPELKGHFRLERVFFRYGNPDAPYILQDINLDIEAGQMIAIVGLSGSGKSTLAKLLMGFYPVTEGRILVDGYDLSQVELRGYRAQIGYVMQTNMLFKGTIEENIAVGESEPDRQRIIEVAKQADAHGFISQLALGYQQPLGEHGVGLSGGQLQRLCIARALYTDPKVLILDEATASLDAQSEGNILDNMDRIMAGRTTVVIAHRLSTVRRADKILVLYNGAIVEQGTHQSLLQNGGMYQQLINKQMAADG